MSLLKKYAASRTTTTPKETVYGKLLSFNGTKPVLVNNEPKEQIVATISTEAGTHDYWLFRDSVYGLPNFIPAGGVPCALTLRETVDANDPSKSYVNAISLGVGA